MFYHGRTLVRVKNCDKFAFFQSMAKQMLPFPVKMGFVQEWTTKYKDFVSENPEAVGNIESLVRIASYLVPGSKSGDSSVLSEFLYSTASLMTLVNDAILRQAADIKIRVPVRQRQLMNWLSVLEYIEVVLCADLFLSSPSSSPCHCVYGHSLCLVIIRNQSFILTETRRIPQHCHFIIVIRNVQQE